VLATFEDGIVPDKSVASNLPVVNMLLAKPLLIVPIVLTCCYLFN